MSRSRKNKRRRLEAPIALSAVLETSGEHKRSPYPPPVDLVVWAKLAGAAIARRSEPRSLRDGVLIVQVTSAAWAQELSFLQSSLVEKLKQAGYAVRELRFRTGPLPGKEPAPPRRPTVVAKPIPANVEAALRTIEDEELREVLTQAGRYVPQS